MAFSKSVIRSQMPINCNLCETEKNIKWKCLTCRVLMCSTCKDKIHLRIGKGHKVHKKHDLTEISDAYKLKIDKIKQGQIKLQNEIYEITATKDQLNQFQNAENSNYAKVSTELLNHEKSYKAAVDKHIAKLRNELDQKHNTSSKVNEESISLISESERQIKEKYENGQDFLNTTDIIRFFQEVNKIEKSAEVSIPKPGTSNRTLQFIPGEITQSTIGVLQSVDILIPKVFFSLSIVNQYQTNLSVVSYLTTCHDDTLWIACNTRNDTVVQKLKPTGSILKTISTFNIWVLGMAITSSDDLLLVVRGKSRLQMISSFTGGVTDTVYTIHPFCPIAIHVTSENQIILGSCYNDGRRMAVIVINKNGDQEAVYEHDHHNQPLFKLPRRITTTSNGNIHVTDYSSKEDFGELVVLRKDGNVINIYKGDTEINRTIPFRPGGIVTTPRDNGIVVDGYTGTLHMMSHSGHLIRYIKTKDNGIEFPFSLAATPTGQLYIGCTQVESSTTKEAKLYQVNISEC
ncbi:Hypothetical predicted protein [Mytilus galloprovincialis]|uniref:B box-type domain-containing protein n=1 Tax=Mytilus galloprovincialis TaxID=29158 RepID=A0A8B6GXV8_MYTGA|nr:Hypothetical predicted protein [Mytilus galloprovincialis]